MKDLKKVNNWLENEKAKGNTLAITFHELLKNADDDVKERYLSQIAEALTFVENIKKERGRNNG
jgi:hypothetical protein